MSKGSRHYAKAEELLGLANQDTGQGSKSEILLEALVHGALAVFDAIRDK